MSMTSKLDARERVKDDGRSASFPRQLKPKKNIYIRAIDHPTSLPIESIYVIYHIWVFV